MDVLSLLIGLVAGALVGAAAASLDAARRRGELASRAASLEATADALRDELDRRVDEAAHARVREREEQAVRERRADEEQRVLTALAPVRQQLDTMRRTVAAIEEQRLQQQGELSEQLRLQHESDERLRATTEGLSAALRSSSARGAWGEAQLRNVVESAGLLERVDFDVQPTLAGEAGRVRPDLVVHLPGGKHLVVDAKAPLAKYLAAQELTGYAGDDEARLRERHLADHAKALRGHVVALADRRYPSAVDGSPELVIAYVPSESALGAALTADPALLDDAFARGVALASPVTLWTVLRAVAQSWRHDQLSDAAREMHDLSRLLYARLSTAATHLDKLGRALTSTVGTYNAFVASLETRVLPAARRLGELDGGDPLASPPRVDDVARGLSAPELLAARDLAYPDESIRRDAAASSSEADANTDGHDVRDREANGEATSA